MLFITLIIFLIHIFILYLWVVLNVNFHRRFQPHTLSLSRRYSYNTCTRYHNHTLETSGNVIYSYMYKRKKLFQSSHSKITDKHPKMTMCLWTPWPRTRQFVLYGIFYNNNAYILCSYRERTSERWSLVARSFLLYILYCNRIIHGSTHTHTHTLIDR